MKRGDDFAKWDFEVRNGILGRARALMTIEEHGAGKQYIRFKCTPFYSVSQFLLPVLLLLLSVFAMVAEQYIVASTAITIMCLLTTIVFIESARSANSLLNAFEFEGVETLSKMNEVEITEVSNRVLIDAIDSTNLLHTLQGISNKTTLKTTLKKRETVE